MKTLYLDIGNSFLKIAEKTESGWEILFMNSIHATQKLIDFLNKAGDFRLIAGSVLGHVINMLKEEFSPGRIMLITPDQIPAGWLDYDTPYSLGIDRFLACLGAYSESKRNVIVVDAGTACTVDLMTLDHIYRGGVIMPGLKVFHQAMAQYLPELPEIDQTIPRSWPGKSTREGMQWGLNGAFVLSVEMFIKKHIDQAGDETDIFVTGGDAESLITSSGETFTFLHRPYLVFEGMYELGGLRIED